LLKIILFITLAISSFANNLVDIYRMQGLSAVEDKLDEELSKLDYWKKHLENRNIELGYYESKQYVIVAQKELQELLLYKNENSDFSLVSRNNIITGEVEGDKFKEGDKKTPEGAYDLLSKKTDVDKFYGPLALVTSYPNTFDKSMKKDGYGIWIHGMPLDEERESFTKGCIALDNDKLENLDSNIDINKAVLLTSQSELKKARKEEIALILSSIYKWKQTWKTSQIEEYLNFYSLDFKRKDGTNFETFSRIKKTIFSRAEKKSIKFSNINISPYPNSLNKNMFRVIMDEDYKSPAVKFKGKKELFLEIVNNEVKILVES